MSFNFSTVAANGPTPTAPAAKDIQCKAVKLTSADFTTGGAASVKAYLPQDASIIRMTLWVKTQLAGGSISAATLSIGVTGTATKFVNATSSAFNAAGSYGSMNISNIVQDQGVETGDIALLFTGTATTGNPSSGEMYVLIEYVR